MPRPRIFTADFWTRRIDALTDHAPRAIRTGCQAVVLVVGQAATPVQWVEADLSTLGKTFVGGCLAWVVTTLAYPPKA